MLRCIPISFPSCQICSSHSNCHICAARWEEDLSLLPGITQIGISTKPLTAQVESPLSSEDLTDLLEDRGILVQD